MAETDDFEGAIAQALESALPAGWASVPAGAVTAFVVAAAPAGLWSRALAVVLPALERVGLRRGRSFVLAGAAPAGARARVPSSAAGLPLLVHDPELSPHFRVGTTSLGVAIDLDDELREAEAVVALGEIALDPGEGFLGGPRLIYPGLASASSRRAHEALGPRVLGEPALDAEGRRAGDLHDRNAWEAAGLLGVELHLCWIRRGSADHGAAARFAAWAGPGEAPVRAARVALLEEAAAS